MVCLAFLTWLLACPWTCPCERERAWWQLGAETEAAPGTCSVCLVLALKDCTLAGGAIVLPCHQWLLSCFPLGTSSLTSSAWQSCHTPVSSCTVIRPRLFSFSFYGNVIIFAVLCVFFLGWLHLLKEGTPTTCSCPLMSICHGFALQQNDAFNFARHPS